MDRIGYNFLLFYGSSPNIDIQSFRLVVTETFSTSANVFVERKGSLPCNFSKLKVLEELESSSCLYKFCSISHSSGNRGSSRTAALIYLPVWPSLFLPACMALSLSLLVCLYVCIYVYKMYAVA